MKVARDVLAQVMLLAGPGVLLGCLSIALVARYVFPYGWSWSTSLVFGSILSATDPVAVVALFNTLGVSPRLTMLISGESLLNDGTAIVCFTLMMQIMMGSHVTVGSCIVFFLNMTVVAVLVGIAVAAGTLVVISWCSESNYHTDVMIQVVMTIVCSFLCFFLAETEASTSGVIAVVSAGFIFSYVAWPRFVSRESMIVVWEALEFLGNTLIFLLAGLLWGSKVTERMSDYLEPSDFGWLVVLYIFLALIRAFMMVAFLPVLNRCGQEVTWQECVVTVWAGLRGAVGLVLAIVVDLEPTVDNKISSQIMFHVGGIAMLTICINATTCGPLLRYLDLTKTPEIEEQTRAHFERLTHEHGKTCFDEIVLKKDDARFVGANVETVEALVPHLAHVPSPEKIRPNADSIADKLQTYREAFMRSVRHHYWQNIEGGVIPRTSRVARVLLYSTDSCMENSKSALSDWKVVADNTDDRQALPRLNRICESWPLCYITPLQQLLPSANTMMMWKVYASVSFIEAHKAAQKEVASYFGDSVLGKTIQEQVNKESTVQCDQAEAVLRRLPEDAVKVGKSRMLAGRLLQLQLEQVKQLKEEGMLTEKAASRITHRINEQRRNVAGVTLRSSDFGVRD